MGLTDEGAGTAAARVSAIRRFLEEARRALQPYNVFLAVDVFGYVCWNTNDTGIGQQLESLAEVVDYISPMLYPSSFQFGIPGFRNPVQHPYEFVRRSLEQALHRTRLAPVRFRPWLQAFADYAFGTGDFKQGEIRRQIQAADDAGTGGWMLWNPRNRYSAHDLTTRARPCGGQRDIASSALLADGPASCLADDRDARDGSAEPARAHAGQGSARERP
jgi:hypothetical protein